MTTKGFCAIIITDTKYTDGPIRNWPRPASIEYHFTVDAAYGPADNKAVLLETLHYLNNAIILTNSLVALDHRYGWNEKEHHTDIYFYVESRQDFVRCDELAGREIRQGHNIMKMYLNGAFDLNKEKEK